MARSVPEPAPALRLLPALAIIWTLAACSSTQIDSIPHEIGGLPQGSPARPPEGQAPAYPAVHDMPPTRSAALLDAEQQKRLEDDLVNLRNRQPNQEKNRVKDAKKKADAKRKADAKTAPRSDKDKDKRKNRKSKKGQPAQQAAAPAEAQPAGGAPPWPLPPPPATGAGPRP